ncbi:bifunctional fucokinase/fucose pyrophosphorylase isoform X1 [Juglans microcarpa x Juglans regia]|uniref:bifunctional fucokinase/fucose pyrophosphorylase isoform X1 n=1 Tax=Juglans microcarpa x Juglans regia TaxID=2249226 RepID=UPI001B7E749B|nr:bifunctional fucokinase/fucose pyrophosphorylase isoform X1 [Juglans microcarpa x Juglans regia]
MEMETPSDKRFSTTKQRPNRRKADLAAVLRKSWYRLRLSVRHPDRVPTWDAIVLTAASPQQAQLYDWQLSRAKRMGRISASTITLAVPDPDGQRIGSGAATLHAIHALAAHYHKLGLHLDPEDAYDQQVATADNNSTNNASSHMPMVRFLAKRHILLLHAGGDSKRVPWANPMGKVFLPLPYMGADDPDGPVPLLFEHVLAIASCARQAFKNEGGLFIMTGDVLPCFDASTMILPEDASCIITVPITLDIASNHGVIVASQSEIMAKSYSVSLVDNLLQKPSIEELVKSNAILDDGRTLLDTGIIAARGQAWVELVKLSCSCEPLILELLKSRKEMSLYEDLVAAWVPAKHEWLQQRPLGQELVSGLGKTKMFSYFAFDLLFLHFGTSSEVLDHLSGASSGLVDRRHLCSIPATTVSDIAASAVVLSSKIAPGVSVGEDSLIYDSSIFSGVQIGSQCIVVGINVPGDNGKTAEDSFRFMLPDRHCLWEVPLVGCIERVIVYCGLHDNPKNSLSRDGTFCGRPWKKVLLDLGIQETDLWSSTVMQDKCLWNANIFAILPYFEMLTLATWLMGLSDQKTNYLLPLWKNARRVSLEELHRSIDFTKLCIGSSNHQADLAAGIAKACINYGMLGRNLSQLCEEILQNDVSGVEMCKDFLDLCPKLQEQNSRILPKSRAYQVHVDLLRACNDEAKACELEHKVWAAVADETASAVKYGFKEYLLESPSKMSASTYQNKFDGCVDRFFHPRSVKVELPVRVDFVGGWSDTPPWSLERAGCVLNMAINLEGSLPIGTIIETTKTAGVLIGDDAGNQLHIEDVTSIATPFDSNDPFRLVKSALLVTGIVHDNSLESIGLLIRTWANVPRGSGLGTSSILAAAVVKGLLQITKGDENNENVARLVLVLEQLMGTGGGWQDQIGGLYPGIKFTASFPGIPLRLQVIPLLASPQLILELQQRLLVIFTGQVRLAHQVLHKVVTRYLQRDNLLVSSIKRLAELAKIGREALMNCEINEMGEIMLEAWRLHQELDPHCSNKFVDRLFSFADPYCSGYKLVGAGGGGFALLLAKDAFCAKELRQSLEADSSFDVKIYDWKVFLQY